MTNPAPLAMRGVDAFISDSSKIENLQSIAQQAPAQFVDPCILVPSPYQPRTFFPEDEMNELRESIEAAGGIKSPLIVRPFINEIIAGGRRKIIAIERGDLLVPVYWHQCSDREAAEFAGFENVKRADLNPIDETNLVLNMLVMRLGLTDRAAAIELTRDIHAHNRRQHEVQNGINVDTENTTTITVVSNTIKEFTKGGISLHSFVIHRIKAVELPTEIAEAVHLQRIDYSTAVEIAKVEDPDSQQKLLNRTIEQDLSVKEVKAEVAKTKPPKAQKKKPPTEDISRKPDINEDTHDNGDISGELGFEDNANDYDPPESTFTQLHPSEIDQNGSSHDNGDNKDPTPSYQGLSTHDEAVNEAMDAVSRNLYQLESATFTEQEWIEIRKEVDRFWKELWDKYPQGQNKV
jgi:ParB family transcriptional regulator, chromosome partitioning protein